MQPFDPNRYFMFRTLTHRVERERCMSRRIVFYGLIAATLLLPHFSSATPSNLIAWYQFFQGRSIGKDLSGNGNDAHIIGENPPQLNRNGLVFAGNGGLEIPSSTDIDARNGFTVEMWVEFSDVGNVCDIISKDGAYFIRIDPPGEGGKISFFVNAGNTLEPRISGPVPKTGHLYHIIAVWNQTRADLWVDDHLYSKDRFGPLSSENSPILIGSSYKWAPGDLKGVMKEVRIYNAAFGRGEVMAHIYDIDTSFGRHVTSQRSFQFASGLNGWRGHDIGSCKTLPQGLELHCRGERSAIISPLMNIPAKPNRYVSIRMALNKGETARLLCVTTKGAFLVPFDVQPDGLMHSYILDLADHIRWSGNLLAAALQPSDAFTKVRLAFILFSPYPNAPADLFVKEAFLQPPLSRAGRNCPVLIKLGNRGKICEDATATLKLPVGIFLSAPPHGISIPSLPYHKSVTLIWNLKAAKAMRAHLRLIVSDRSRTLLNTLIPVSFAPPFHQYKAKYVPPPKVVKSDLMVGAMMCPLWTQGTRQGGWQEIQPYPNREPLLGWYDENSPEATDWQIKWCLEHAISYFVYCWYRVGVNGPVRQTLGEALHQGLFKSRYGSMFKFAIMWENANGADVSSRQDLMDNLLPFWIKNYFSRSNYLKVDGKPLLFIYDPPRLAQDLGGTLQARQAIEDMRRACRKAGFAGLTVLGEYRGTDKTAVRQMKDMGMDYSFAYCWPIPGEPAPAKAVAEQVRFWKERRDMNILPSLVTVSMGWNPSPWYPTRNRWRLPPSYFKTLCEDAKQFIGNSKSPGLQNRMVLIDNWNEFGEGHYIEPTRQYGFGYLDAIRSVFTHAKTAPDDIIPQDVGLGPYDHLFKKYLRLQAMCATRVTAPGGNAPGLIGWWTFEKARNLPVSYDYSGHGHGGQIIDADIVKGEHGNALVCHGGCVSVPPSPNLCPSKLLTVEAWIKVEAPNQQDRWFVNCVGGNGENGYRMGISGGGLCFEIPKTAWSHSLSSPTPLPLDKWIFVAGSYDGTTIRLYENGRECAKLYRGGRIGLTNQSLCLGDYAVGHPAHFIGLLSDVRIYSICLSPTQIASDESR